MGDKFYKWNELSGREKILAIDNFRTQEKKNFDSDYTILKAVDVLREREDFIKDVDDNGKVVDVN